jgi:citrate lyase subunit beta/citryl-CoA lyase
MKNHEFTGLVLRFPTTYLFVPATRPDRISKALSLDVDVVIVDLEDAVAESEKDLGRSIVSHLRGEARLFIRINSARTPHFESDVVACGQIEGLGGVVLPMVEGADEIDRLRPLLESRVGVFALVETPRGILAAEEIASSGAERLMFGCADYSSAVHAAPSNELFAYPRSCLVVASAAAGLPAPVDGPTTSYDDPLALREDLRAARALGMGAKQCIHPSQVQAAREAFEASTTEREWAQAVLRAAESHYGSVFAMDGEMVDEPVIERARGIMRS